MASSIAATLHIGDVLVFLDWAMGSNANARLCQEHICSLAVECAAIIGENGCNHFMPNTANYSAYYCLAQQNLSRYPGSYPGPL